MQKVNDQVKQQDQVNQSQPLAKERAETLRAAQGDGQGCVERDERGRVLFQVGDEVTIPFLRYPGPVPAPTKGRVIRRHSPTYYLIEYTDGQGHTKQRSFIRSYFPD